MLKVGEKKEPSLKRNINLFQAVMYGVGLILGAGIYVLIGDAAGIASSRYFRPISQLPAATADQRDLRSADQRG